MGSARPWRAKKTGGETGRSVRGDGTGSRLLGRFPVAPSLWCLACRSRGSPASGWRWRECGPLPAPGRKQRAFAPVAVGSGHFRFILKDVCEVLELDNIARVKTRLDQQDHSSTGVLANDGKRYQTSIVNESGLYDVIFQSRTAGR
ncbi:BRO-N domain-containing protein [Corynebacterium coyleae]|uniref:BRO-N domain-containing protein n=1 Tax=Corynebacterium coyleae TaxID=53374 RepID=UPI003D7314C2